MHPILFEIGPFQVHSYGLALAAAYIVAVCLAGRDAARCGISSKFITDLLFVLMVSGIIGARAFYIMMNYPEFIARPVEIFMFWRGGLVFYGGFLAALSSGILFIKRSGYPFFRVADRISPYMALGHSIGRIGCLLNGCCYGKPTAAWFGITFADHPVKLHPSQIYSSLGLLSIFVLLRYVQSRPHREGDIFIAYCVLYGLLRFTVEFTRGDPSAVFIGLRLPQILSLLLIGFAFLLYAKGRKRGRA